MAEEGVFPEGRGEEGKEGEGVRLAGVLDREDEGGEGEVPAEGES